MTWDQLFDRASRYEVTLEEITAALEDRREEDGQDT